MKKLFLRIYLGLLLGFAITTVAVVGWLLHESSADRTVVEDSLRGGVTLAHQVLVEPGHRPRQDRLIGLTEQFGYSVEVVPVARIGLSEDETDRLFTSNDIVVNNHFVYRRFGEHEVLQMGPLPDFQLNRGGTWIGLFVVLVWGIVSALVLLPVLRTSRELERATDQMATGDFSTRIDPDKIAMKELALSFNGMAERTEMLISEQKDLLAAVSHEFRTPLARLRFASDIANDATGESLKELLREIDTNVVELEQLVSEILGYIRLGSTELDEKTFVVTDELSDVVTEFSTVAETGTVRLTIENDTLPDLRLPSHRMFQRVVRNLLSNALRFANAYVCVRVYLVDAGVCIQVSDDGPGIAQCDRVRALLPFVQLGTPQQHQGVGLGLAIVARICERVGGHVSILDSEDNGACIKVVWPVV